MFDRRRREFITRFGGATAAWRALVSILICERNGSAAASHCNQRQRRHLRWPTRACADQALEKTTSWTTRIARSVPSIRNAWSWRPGAIRLRAAACCCI